LPGDGLINGRLLGTLDDALGAVKARQRVSAVKSLLLNRGRSCSFLEGFAYSIVNRFLYFEDKVVGTGDVADDHSGDSSGAGKRLGDVQSLLLRGGSGDQLGCVEYVVSHFGGLV
jgi:hypothetical protein